MSYRTSLAVLLLLQVVVPSAWSQSTEEPGPRTVTLDQVRADRVKPVAWSERFGRPDLPGVIRYSIDFNGELVVASSGDIYGAEGAASVIHAWDGQRWRALGALYPAEIKKLGVYHGDLFAAGDFDLEIDGERLQNIARWDGEAWSPLAEGVDGPVVDLVEFYGDLVAVGGFRHAGALDTGPVAAWDDGSWRAMGEPVDADITAAAIFQGNLVLAFRTTPPSWAFRLLRIRPSGVWESFWYDPAPYSFWVEQFATSPDNVVTGPFVALVSDGAQQKVRSASGRGWYPVGDGNATIEGIRCVAYQGTVLWMGGEIVPESPNRVWGLAWHDWSAHVWVEVAPTLRGRIHHIRATDGGLRIAGDFAIPRPNGKAYTDLLVLDPQSHEFTDPVAGPMLDRQGLDGGARDLYRIDGAIYVLGSFHSAGGEWCNGLASWKNDTWTPYGPELNGIKRELHFWNGDAVVIGDILQDAEGNSFPGSVVLNEGRWLALQPEGCDVLTQGWTFEQHFFAVARFGTDRTLLHSAGSTWEDLGWPGEIRDAIVVDDQLLVAGRFQTEAGVLPLLTWDGAQWSPYGSDLSIAGLEGYRLNQFRGGLVVAVEDTGPGSRDALIRYKNGRWHEFGKGLQQGSKIRQLTTAGSYLVVVLGYPAVRPPGVGADEALLLWDDKSWWGGGLVGLIHSALPQGNHLYVTGASLLSDGIPFAGFARWDARAESNGEDGPIETISAARQGSEGGRIWSRRYPGGVALRLTLAAGESGSLGIYDLRGRQVWSTHLGPNATGQMQVEWNGVDQEGQHVGRGVYFVRVETPSTTLKGKVLLLR